MKMCVKKKILSAVLATTFMLGSAAYYAPVAEANILGTVIGGIAAHRQLDQQISYYDETEEGRQELFAGIKEKYGVVYDSPYEERTRRAIERLSAGIAQTNPAIKEKPFLWFINPDTTFNAFCTLGHVMSINQGFYTYVQNEDEIAVVLGHEMAHGLQRHGAKGMRKRLNAALGTSIAAGSVGGGALSGVVLDAIYTNITNVQITGKQEWEADKLALEYVLAAGYNPGAAPAVWQRFIEQYGDNEQNFVGEMFDPSDHPAHSERRDKYIKTLKDMSGGKVNLKGNTITIGDKRLLQPAPISSMSSEERACFVLGNLAAAYKNGQHKSAAHVEGNTVLLGNQPIITVMAGDDPAQTIADRLNELR